MNAPQNFGLVADPSPRRRGAAAAPLDVWLRALLGFLLVYATVAAWFVLGRTPMPVEFDS